MGRPGRRERPGRGSAIHDGLIGARQLIGTPYLADPQLRREYARDIAPRTRAALAKILAEVFPAPEAPPRRALDLGTGTGAAAEALRAHFGARIDVVGVDRVAAPGLVTADLAAELPAVSGRFDLIVAAHLLGELFIERRVDRRIDGRTQRVRAWVEQLLEGDGTLILVEPALRETSRELLAVRDQLLASSDLDVVAPCFWRGACPALANPRDWCHDAAPVRFAPRVDFSYLVLRNGRGAAPEEGRYRVVSDSLPEKGRLKLYGCGPTGRHPFVRLKRHASPANAAFGDLVRGDVARITGATTANDGLRIEAATTVACVPASANQDPSPRPAKRGEG